MKHTLTRHEELEICMKKLHQEFSDYERLIWEHEDKIRDIRRWADFVLENMKEIESELIEIEKEEGA